jgi:Fe-S-cluster containining protein
MRKVDGRCFFLHRSKCSIYKARPLICRFYPFSLDSTKDGEMKIEFDPLCSGIGKGKVRNESFFQGLVRLARTELSKE